MTRPVGASTLSVHSIALRVRIGGARRLGGSRDVPRPAVAGDPGGVAAPSLPRRPAPAAPPRGLRRLALTAAALQQGYNSLRFIAHSAPRPPARPAAECDRW